jgi:hypothetical protein
LSAWSATAATTATRSTGPATPPAPIVVIRRGPACANRLADWNRSTLNPIEVWLGLLIEFLAALFLVEVVAALNQDGALI